MLTTKYLFPSVPTFSSRLICLLAHRLVMRANLGLRSLKRASWRRVSFSGLVGCESKSLMKTGVVMVIEAPKISCLSSPTEQSEHKANSLLQRIHRNKRVENADRMRIPGGYHKRDICCKRNSRAKQMNRNIETQAQ